jgi:hypothetical protein
VAGGGLEEVVRTFLSLVACGVVALVLTGLDPRRGGEARGTLAEAEAAVDRFLATANAYYESGGDPRAAERIPAAPGLVGEMAADIAFVQHTLQRAESRRLVRVDHTGARWLTGGGAEVRTREFWVVRLRPLFGDRTPPHDESAVLPVSYDVARDGDRWVVVDYRLEAARSAGGT